jgi:hypothetical protein
MSLFDALKTRTNRASPKVFDIEIPEVGDASAKAIIGASVYDRRWFFGLVGSGVALLALNACSGGPSVPVAGVLKQPISGEPGIPGASEQESGYVAKQTATSTRVPARQTRATRTATATESPTSTSIITPDATSTPTATVRPSEVLGIEKGVIPVTLESSVSGVKPGDNMSKIFTESIIEALSRTKYLQPVMGNTPEAVQAYLTSHDWVLPPEFLIPQRIPSPISVGNIQFAPSEVPVDLSRGIGLSLAWSPGSGADQDILDGVAWIGNGPSDAGVGDGVGFSVDEHGRLFMRLYIQGNENTSGNPPMQAAVATMLCNVSLATLQRMTPIDPKATQQLGNEFVRAYTGTATNQTLLLKQNLFQPAQ